MCRDARLLDGIHVSTPNALTQVMQQIEEGVALKSLNVDDSEAAWGSQGDRHEIVAKGLIGHECFEQLKKDSNFGMVPSVTETPVQWHGLT